MSQKKVAFLIFPGFCNYEIALTLAVLYDRREIVTFGIDKKPMRCEEGFQVVADRTLSEFAPDEYDCLLISGIGGSPDDVLYNQTYIEFLRQFQGRGDILIASMSLSPALIAQAGLLQDRKFCIGMVEEDRDEFAPFLNYENQVRAPIVVDGNVITAMGHALREFAVEVARKLDVPCRGDVFAPVKYPIDPKDYVFHAGG